MLSYYMYDSIFFHESQWNFNDDIYNNHAPSALLIMRRHREKNSNPSISKYVIMPGYDSAPESGP